ncbi:MAG: hypothetical protein NT027_19555 [Proteobacteria bacterium]|nr:hypothetical protein [Pseudomonadota bacterium]
MRFQFKLIGSLYCILISTLSCKSDKGNESKQRSMAELEDISRVNEDESRTVICNYGDGKKEETVSRIDFLKGNVCINGVPKNPPSITALISNEKYTDAVQNLTSLLGKFSNVKCFEGNMTNTHKLASARYGIQDRRKGTEVFLFDHQLGWQPVYFSPLLSGVSPKRAWDEGYWFNPSSREYGVFEASKLSNRVRVGSILVGVIPGAMHYEILGIVSTGVYTNDSLDFVYVEPFSYITSNQFAISGAHPSCNR